MDFELQKCLEIKKHRYDGRTILMDRLYSWYWILITCILWEMGMNVYIFTCYLKKKTIFGHQFVFFGTNFRKFNINDPLKISDRSAMCISFVGKLFSKYAWSFVACLIFMLRATYRRLSYFTGGMITPMPDLLPNAQQHFSVCIFHQS